MPPDSRSLIHQDSSAAQMELHPSWSELTERQRECINELWNDMVIPALEQVETMRRRVEDAQLAKQDAEGVARRVQELADQGAESERRRRQELHAEIARLRQRVLELECPEVAA